MSNIDSILRVLREVYAMRKLCRVVMLVRRLVGSLVWMLCTREGEYARLLKGQGASKGVKEKRYWPA